jgi:hypothetical protein
VLAVMYQLRSLLVSFVDFNILFEFISLLHIILTEEKKSMAQILYLKKIADSTVVEKYKIL